MTMKTFMVRNIPDETMQELKIICVKKNVPVNSLLLQLIENIIKAEKAKEQPKR